MDLTFTSANELSSAQDNEFRVVILCQEAATAEIACDMLLLLRRQLQYEAGRLSYQWWTFEFLAARELREQFAAQTASANMIIIGAQDASAFPEGFADWLEQLPDLRNPCPGALIAVLAPNLGTPDAEPGMFSRLKQAAELSHMDFFATQVTQGLVVGTFPTICYPSLPTLTKDTIETAEPHHFGRSINRNDCEGYLERIRRR